MATGGDFNSKGYETKEETETEEYETEHITKEDIKLIQTLRCLGIKPKVESTEDVIKMMKTFGNIKEEQKDDKQHVGNHHFPKLSTFFGEEGKGEATWEKFKYEVEALLIENCFTETQILQGIRRSIKGSAGEKIRRLGPGANLRHVMEKLESSYGMVETKETAMK